LLWDLRARTKFKTACRTLSALHEISPHQNCAGSVRDSVRKLQAEIRALVYDDWRCAARLWRAGVNWPDTWPRGGRRPREIFQELGFRKSGERYRSPDIALMRP
jgi:hypothetical protein